MSENANGSESKSAGNRNQAQLKVRRVLEIQGDAAWVQGTLARSIGSTSTLALGVGGIREMERTVLEGELDPRFVPRTPVRPLLVYIAGKFAGTSPEDHQRNVEQAAAYRQPIADLGCYPVCPHTNTRDLGGPDGRGSGPKDAEFWYAGSCELLRRCDVLLLIPGWRESRGAGMERDMAEAWRIPVVESLEAGDVEALKAWLGTPR